MALFFLRFFKWLDVFFFWGTLQEIRMNFISLSGRVHLEDILVFITPSKLFRFWGKRHLWTAFSFTFVLAPVFKNILPKIKVTFEYFQTFSHLKSRSTLVVEGHPKLWIVSSNFKKRFLDPEKWDYKCYSWQHKQIFL